jgi:hypothetical protein
MRTMTTRTAAEALLLSGAARSPDEGIGDGP